MKHENRKKFRKGTFRATAGSFGFVTDENGNEYHISKENRFFAVDQDEVLFLPMNDPCYGNRMHEAKIKGILSHGLDRITGTLLFAKGNYRTKAHYYVVPDSKKCDFNVIIEEESAKEAETGDKVEVKLTSYPSFSSTAMGIITKDYGASDSLEANYSSLLNYHSIRTLFPDEVLDEAEKQSKRSVEPEKRLDLRDKLIFTIDGADAKDLDDAISVEKKENGYLLGVHIADVSEYVKENSPVDKEAYERGTSVYFADRVVPMLPKSLSNGICSLNQGEDRFALSALISLDKKGQILSLSLKESVINSKIRGVYSELNDVEENGKKSAYYEKYAILFPDVFPILKELYLILEDKNKKRGSIEFETSEAKILLDHNGMPTEIIRREQGLTEKMIEQFMLCANEAVASYMQDSELPCVYRIHDKPETEKLFSLQLFASNMGLDTTPVRVNEITPKNLAALLNEAKDKGLDTILSHVMLRSMAKAKYSSECKGHFGLATEKYCHFTSPIRRYPDLCTHRMIKLCLHNKFNEKNIEKYETFVADAAAKSSEKELDALYAERDIEDLFKTVYMTKFIGEEFDGIINSVTSFGFFVELESTCEGLVPVSSLDGYFVYNDNNLTLSSGDTVFSLGQQVRIKVKDTDIITRKTEFEVIMPISKPIPRKSDKKTKISKSKTKPQKLKKYPNHKSKQKSKKSFRFPKTKKR